MGFLQPKPVDSLKENLQNDSKYAISPLRLFKSRSHSVEPNFQSCIQGIFGANCPANLDNSIIQPKNNNNKGSKKDDKGATFQFSSSWDVECGVRVVDLSHDFVFKSSSHGSSGEADFVRVKSFPIVPKSSKFSSLAQFFSKKIPDNSKPCDEDLDEDPSRSVNPHMRRKQSALFVQNSINALKSSYLPHSEVFREETHPGINKWSYLSNKSDHKTKKEKDGFEWIRGRAGEDYCHISVSKDLSCVYASIFDGFYGSEAAEFLAIRFFSTISENIKKWVRNLGKINLCTGTSQAREREFEIWKSSVTSSLVEALKAMEEKFFSVIEKKREENGELAMVGTTLIVILVIERHVFSVNLGDSRSLVCSSSSSNSSLPSTSTSSYTSSNGEAIPTANECPNQNGIIECSIENQEEPKSGVEGYNAKGNKESFFQLVRQHSKLAKEKESEEKSDGGILFSPISSIPCERSVGIEFEEEAKMGDVYVTTTQLSNDHNVESEEEISLISALHPEDGQIVKSNRLKGHLKLTRGFGCGFLKHSKWNSHVLGKFRFHYYGEEQYLMSDPHVEYYHLNEDNQFLMISSDGIFSYFTNEQVIRFVDQSLRNAPNLNPAAALIAEVFQRLTLIRGLNLQDLEKIPLGERRRELHDDLSIIIIQLN